MSRIQEMFICDVSVKEGWLRQLVPHLWWLRPCQVLLAAWGCVQNQLSSSSFLVDLKPWPLFCLQWLDLAWGQVFGGSAKP